VNSFCILGHCHNCFRSWSRRCVEYDLESSSAVAGVSCVLNDDQAAGRILDQSALPTALMWHPHILGDVEDRFVLLKYCLTIHLFRILHRFIVSTSEYKFKELNVDSKKVRRTTLAPTFAQPANRMILIPTGGRGPIAQFAYSCPSMVLGIASLPLTGNPNKVVACCILS
jgi:hypothetical protein